jgi:hypothetical protein
MKQSQIVDAYKVIQKYEQKELPLKISLAFFKLKRKLQDQWDFEVQEENKIVEKYHPRQEGSNLVFDRPEDRIGFTKDLADLMEMEVDYDEQKIDIDIGDSLMLSVSDIEALDEFITF